MLDLSYFQNQNSNVQGFFNGGTWQTWIKPRGAKLVNIICVGSGAGGGGSGGSGATARLTINANLLPDIFYVLPGIGGAGGLGGAPAAAGTAGQNSFITLIPSTTSVSNVILRSGTTPATQGGAGTTSGGSAGAAETIGVIGNNIFANLGTFTFQAGIAGQGGWFVNTVNTTPSNFLVGAGGGGGGSNGSVTATGVFPGLTAQVATGANGQDGPIYYKPTLMLYGGRGGVGGANGGKGGNGAPGCGGGGGGTSTNIGVNAGNGGRGGNGFVIITTSL